MFSIYHRKLTAFLIENWYVYLKTYLNILEVKKGLDVFDIDLVSLKSISWLLMLLCFIDIGRNDGDKATKLLYSS